MAAADLNQMIKVYDIRRDIALPGNRDAAFQFAVNHFIHTANEAIKAKGAFFVALCGGNTPRTVFQMLSSADYRRQVDWSKIFLFWGDERCVPPDHADSNYHMAMRAGFASLPIPKEHIFRMAADNPDLEKAALDYEKLIEQIVPAASFDLVMLGMGNDGHTASLFPKTHGLHSQDRLVVANYIPSKEIWRMTVTFPCINSAKTIVLYVIGEDKAEMVNGVLTGKEDHDQYPVQRVGTPSHKVLWILDDAAARLLLTT